MKIESILLNLSLSLSPCHYLFPFIHSPNSSLSSSQYSLFTLTSFIPIAYRTDNIPTRMSNLCQKIRLSSSLLPKILVKASIPSPSKLCSTKTSFNFSINNGFLWATFNFLFTLKFFKGKPIFKNKIKKKKNQTKSKKEKN